MKLQDVQSSHTETLVCSVIGDPLNPEVVGSIGYIEKLETLLVLRLRGRVYTLKPHSRKIFSDVELYLTRGCGCLAEVSSTGRKGMVCLNVAFFNGPVRKIGNLQVALPPEMLMHLQLDAKNPLRPEDFLLVVPENEQGKFAYYFTLRTMNGFEHEYEGEEEPPPAPNPDTRRFTLLGKNARLEVALQGDGLHATRLVHSQAPHNTFSFLCRGNLTFCEESAALSKDSDNLLRQISADIEEYFSLWDEFGELEGKLLLDRARSIGKLSVKSCSPHGPRHVKVYFDDIPEDLSDSDSLEIMVNEPLYLSNPEMEFQQYMEEKSSSSQACVFRISQIHRSQLGAFIIMDSDEPIADGTTLILSIRGDEVQIQRQQDARRKVKEGNAANPLLGNIIEGVSSASRRSRGKRIPALSPHVCDKVFRNPPTLRQQEAIDIALNTPDIALIQGPPGTGKTTVINAIIERLNEIADKSAAMRGQILVSAFQHDAVENLTDRLSVNSLPAVKFGRRSSLGASAQEEESRNIEAYVETLAAETRALNPGVSQYEHVSELLDLAARYEFAPSDAIAEALLREIIREPVISSELRSRANQKLSSLLSEAPDTDSVSPLLIRSIRGLRTCPASFADDGALRASLLLDEMNRTQLLEASERELLEEASIWLHRLPPPFLDDLKKLRKSLLERCSPRPAFRVRKVDAGILLLAHEAAEECKRVKYESESADAVIAEFLRQLEYNPEAVRDVLKSYSVVYAATTQQSVGEAISRQKEGQDYDTVIVDEAARCGPRDLLIPMTKARHRILLVGDHRQLPHMVDEEVIRELEKGTPREDMAKLLHMSLFEYMFKQLRKMEEQDGIRRTVTLDAQYRTHPLLGRFVSEAFYESYGEGFSSPLDAGYFDHELPDIEHKAAVWIDVPAKKGPEQRTSAGSRFRKAEVDAIAHYLHRFMESDQGQGLTFGVISFYKAQVNHLLEALAKYKYTERCGEGGNFRVVPEWQKRLRIGTVDAFQGMEFDVVFLSVVRSPASGLRERLRDAAASVSSGRLFGHLQSDNRMCVSMSRQKKCLIAVGEAELFESDYAACAVPALYRYLNLCRTSPSGHTLKYE